MLAGMVCQFCQPPVFAIANVPIGVAPRESSLTSTRPLAPPLAPDATRATNWVASVDPKSTPLYRAQSPLATPAMFCPPPVSVVAWVRMPDWESYDSASIRLYALRAPGGVVVVVAVGVVVGVVVTVGVGVAVGGVVVVVPPGFWVTAM